MLGKMHEFRGSEMSRKVSAESIKRLTVELPESEYAILERYCVARQETKRQVIRDCIRRLGQRRGSQESGVRSQDG